MRTEAELKRVARLRWRIDDDGSVIAVAKKNPYRRDHLYFHGAGVLAVYFQADTPAGATARVKRYRKLLAERIVRELVGEVDGIIQFRATGADDVPDTFKRSAARVEAGLVAMGGTTGTAKTDFGPVRPASRPSRLISACW